eukprot:5075336-Ditylum_brightwellii.AAC.1
MIDACTRWVKLHHLTSKTSLNISQIVDREWFCRYPRPRDVIFDNRTEFTSEWVELLASYGIFSKPTTIKNPQANAICEHIHQTIADSLCTQHLDDRNNPPDANKINYIIQSTAFGL